MRWLGYCEVWMCMFVEDIYINDAKEYAYLIETCRSVETHKEVPFSPLHASPHNSPALEIYSKCLGAQVPRPPDSVSLGWEVGPWWGGRPVWWEGTRPSSPRGFSQPYRLVQVQMRRCKAVNRHIFQPAAHVDHAGFVSGLQNPKWPKIGSLKGSTMAVLANEHILRWLEAGWNVWLWKAVLQRGNWFEQRGCWLWTWSTATWSNLPRPFGPSTPYKPLLTHRSWHVQNAF